MPTANELARRSLHLKLYPNPTTFAHRREVLRILSKYGQVDMFRSLKYHPKTPTGNAFAIIFHTSTSAQAALDASPIRFRVISDDHPVLPHHASIDSSRSISSNSSSSVYSLHVSPTNFSHDKFISSRFTNPLHGPFFPTLPRKSFIASALIRYFHANSLIGGGLLDWETDRGRGILRVRNTRKLDTPFTMAYGPALDKEQKSSSMPST